MGGTRTGTGMLVALLVAACGTGPSDPSGDTGGGGVDRVITSADTATLSLGETVRFEAFGVTVTYRAFEGDSRCPAEVTCVWEGDAAARVQAWAGDAGAAATLHTALEPRTTAVGDRSVTLVDLLPHPVAGVPVEAADTRIRLRVGG